MGRYGSLNEARAKLARAAAQLNARNARGRDLPPIFLMTDDERDVDWAEAVRALPKGCAVIVRHRNLHERVLLACQLAGICAARGVKLLIADDLNLAQRVRADGVHLPQKRIPAIAAARARNPRWLVTASAHGLSSVCAAEALGADAILIAPVFATASHPGRRGMGLVRFATLSHATRTAVYALGGIDNASVQRLSGLQVSGIALIGGWSEL